MTGLVTYPQYDSYKDSGVEWLGEVPEYWKLIRFKDFFSFDKGLTITRENLKEVGVLCVSYGEIHSKFGFELDTRKHALKYVDDNYLKTSPKSLLYKDDFIFADTSEDIKGSGNFTQLVTDDEVFAGYHTVICRPKNGQDNRFLAYLLDSISYRNQIRRAVKGVKVYSITQAILKNTSVWLPNVDEQIRIGNFLNQKTTQIDEAIALKQKQIALLKERKQILIQNAVTQGLNPNAPMKDSGIDWIGQIPEHWDVKRFRNLFNFNKGLTITKDNLQDEGIPCVNYGEIHSKYGFEVNTDNHSLKCVNTDYIKNSTGSLLEFGDFVFADTSEDIDGSGNFTYLNGNQRIFAGYHTVITKPIQKIHHRYIAYFFDSLSFRLQVRKNVKGVKVYSITQTILKKTQVLFPPLAEQAEISSYLDEITKKLTVGIEIQIQQIEKLKEYKTTLINSAVTGKIKVV
ncbi:hypothetical protein JCM30760_22410 [Thiomicrorhabdus hydrogeniphila]